MKRFFILSIFCLFHLNYSSCDLKEQRPSAIDALRQGFRNVPLEARPRALWDWVDGNFSLAEITNEMENAVEMGMGGFDIWDVRSVVDEMSVVPAGPAFMGPESVKAIVHAINEAERLDLDLGLIVASGWNAGGAWTKPEHQTMGIYKSTIIVKGPVKVHKQISFPDIPEKIDYLGDEVPANIQRDEDGLPVFYREIAVTAIPLSADSIISDQSQVMDLSSFMDEKGMLSWEAPDEEWLITRYVCANTGQLMFSHTPNSAGPMIDHFSAEASEAHINYFIDKIEAELEKPIGESGLNYLYTDSYEVRGQLWTPDMIREFEHRMKYSLLPFLPVLDGYVVESEEITQRFMYDYNKVLSDLIIENHYQRSREICESHGIGFVAEAAGPGQPVHNCPFESLKSSGVLSFPRGEFWHIPEKNDYWKPMRENRGHHYLDQLQVIKGVASASHIYNRKFVEAEAFTGVHLWSESPGDLKPTADRAFCEGLNRINFHTYPHSPEAAGEPGWVYSFGTLVSDTRIWWPKAKPFMDYLGRCSYLLQQGNFKGDVLYYYGDKAPNFVPAKHIDPSLGFGYDFDVTNTDILVNSIYVEDGRLKLPHGPTYEVLVLPEVDYILPEILEKIKFLVEEGAIVIGPRPVKSNGLFQWQQRDLQVKELADQLWGDVDGETNVENAYGKGKVIWGKTIREVLTEKMISADFTFSGNVKETELDFIHRTVDGVEVFFLRNRTKGLVDGWASFRAKGKRPEFWDPVTGKMWRIKSYREDGEYVEVPLRLERYGSMFIVLHSEKEQKDLPLLDAGPIGYSSVYVEKDRTDGDSIMIEREVVGIDGPWKVYFPEERKGPGQIEFDKLISWPDAADDRIRFFSGIATYECDVDLGDPTAEGVLEMYIDLGQVRELAEVLINGKSVGITWFEPYRLDITEFIQAGKNTIKIEVANTWANRLAGDAKLPEPERISHSNVVRLPNAWAVPMKDVPNEQFGLMESGMMGPVEVIKIY